MLLLPCLEGCSPNYIQNTDVQHPFGLKYSGWGYTIGYDQSLKIVVPEVEAEDFDRINISNDIHGIILSLYIGYNPDFPSYSVNTKVKKYRFKGLDAKGYKQSANGLHSEELLIVFKDGKYIHAFYDGLDNDARAIAVKLICSIQPTE